MARPRYLRIVVAATAVTVTGVAVGAAADEWSTDGAAYAAPARAVAASAATGPRTVVTADLAPSALRPRDRTPRGPAESPASSAPAPSEEAPPVPARSGSGRRVVFDEEAQRVWLVGRGGAVRRTYLVSGSLTDNLDPGTYEVYSTSVDAVGIDDSGTMKFMVRFTHGDRAAIGFHDIPVKDGKRVQTRDELGEPRSHGCIRQWRPDARALWHFAPVGTTVVVV